MVPNHFGVDSPWVVEHPERFLSVPRSPFPSYSYRGPDLSPTPEIQIHLEDRYYDQTDAAVAFERLDRRTGERRFVYHGNDGTGLPWNDTAQLDYLKAETRRAVLEEIVSVAKRFPIVRFDAAMTLARRHFQRLWYPLPGDGGAIPSRAGHGVDAAAFDSALPTEFWQEVVERVRIEAPDTLLVAEAFWLMEAYFARQLGFHRVYNSAFVHQLRQGRGVDFIAHLREQLAAEPELLARQVNYLSNPDEPTARTLFGSGARYRMAATLLATLPGLPLFAHGQAEGLRERYGLEFRRPRMRESPDPEALALHREHIQPLLRERALFSGAEDFRLYETAVDGLAESPVLAFSNSRGSTVRLVVSNLSEELKKLVVNLCEL
jgi:glycosidase